MVFPILASSQSIVSAGLFYLFALLSVGAAVGVVVSRNIVRTAVFLLFTLAGVAGLYFLLSAEFLAAVQLVIYAGGTLILIVFGVMLTSKSPYSRFEPKRIEIIIALSAGAILLSALILAIVSALHHRVFAENPLIAGQAYPINALGQALLGDFLLPFELASVLLLVVMIGAAFLAKGRRRPSQGNPALRAGEAMVMIDIGLHHYLILAAILFVCGLVTILLKRNAIGILMGVELVLNAANVNLVAFNRYSHGGSTGSPELSGQIFAIFIIVLAAAEAAVALAIFLNFYNNFSTIDVERAQNLKG